MKIEYGSGQSTTNLLNTVAKKRILCYNKSQLYGFILGVNAIMKKRKNQHNIL